MVKLWKNKEKEFKPAHSTFREIKKNFSKERVIFFFRFVALIVYVLWNKINEIGNNNTYYQYNYPLTPF